ncbi:transposable element Tcb1 transposase [Trichonephila clavipes]|nr:transposable element Tcb1 transposase [Trichonephila clavipes]
MSPGLVCSLTFAGHSYGECQVPVNTKRTLLKDTVLLVKDCSFGGIILGSRTGVPVQIGTVTGQVYRDAVLKQRVLFRDVMGAESVFMDENTRPQSVDIVNEFLQSEESPVWTGQNSQQTGM